MGNPPLLPSKGSQVIPKSAPAEKRIAVEDADDDGYLKADDDRYLKVDDNGRLIDVRVVNHVLNKDLTILELKSAVYNIGDQVECRLEDDPTALSNFPSDRRIASMRNRWFKGSISAIRIEGNNMLDDDAGEEYVIAVELRSNKLDDMLSSLSASFLRCFSACPCCYKIAQLLGMVKEQTKQWPTLRELKKIKDPEVTKEEFSRRQEDI